MNDLLMRPFPIRKIKNNNLRRIVMLITFIPILAFGILINACWMPFLFLANVCKCTITLILSMIEFWDNPITTKGVNTT